MPWLCHLVALPRPMGGTHAVREHGPWCTWEPLNIAGRTKHLDIQWGEARGRASFIVIVGLESPPCLIGMDIMRPLRVSIDVTEGTATLAQPDPQTIHLNAAQTQPPQKRPPSQPTNPPPLPQEDPASGASLPTSGTATPSSPGPSARKSRWQRPGVQPPPDRQIFLQLLLKPIQPRPTLLHHLTLLTLTRLAVLGCFKQQTFLPRQLVL